MKREKTVGIMGLNVRFTNIENESGLLILINNGNIAGYIDYEHTIKYRNKIKDMMFFEVVEKRRKNND